MSIGPSSLGVAEERCCRRDGGEGNEGRCWENEIS